MIGVIGAADSVRLALSLAQTAGIADDVIGRSYRSVDEAPAMARELDGLCQVLLFTGRFPYALAKREEGLRAALQYVPHSGADLYGTIVRLLRQRDCHLPRVSLDTIEPEVVREAFEDLGLAPPDHVIPLDIDGDAAGVRSAGDIVAFHRARSRAGDVDVSLTCVGSVYEALVAEGVPAWRITHSKSVVREALRQAHLAERLAITESTQPAAVLIALPRPRPNASDDAGPYEAQRRHLRSRVAILDVAERLQGRLAEGDDETSIIYTSRGTVENAIARRMAGHEGPLSLDRLPEGIRMGVGLGSTVAAAESNARLALRMGERDGALHVGLPEGQVLRVAADRSPTTFHLRETHPAALRVAHELGIGPLAFTRLVRALEQVDASALTAVDLARAYGIEVRSARRLITALQRAGIATRLGSQGGPRAGRPQAVYRIDLDRLLGAGQGTRS